MFVACVAGGIVGARSKVLAVESRGEWGGTITPATSAIVLVFSIS